MVEGTAFSKHYSSGSRIFETTARTQPPGPRRSDITAFGLPWSPCGCHLLSVAMGPGPAPKIGRDVWICGGGDGVV